MEQMTIFTKFCLKCVDEDGFNLVRTWCAEHEILMSVARTTYKPELHKVASRAWGNEFYTIFATFNGKKMSWENLVADIRNNAGKGILGEPAKKKKSVAKGKAKCASSK